MENEHETQTERVLEVLKKQGYIDNFYAMSQMCILRLGARINDLKRSGDIELDNEKSGYVPGTKNYRYVLKQSSLVMA